jgi:protein-S-isoprenylcysteine O-methyltransferase Ste14
MLKVVAYLAPIVTLAAIGTLAVLGSFFTTSPWLLALYLLAVALAVWARTAFPAGAFRGGPPPGGAALIRRGPYRFVRHPMYSAALLLVWSGVIARLTWGTAALGVLVTAVAVARVVYEERLLRAALSDYGEYARSTRALIPFIA